MDMPGPQDYVPVVGFAQKTKMRLTRGPPNSKNSKAPAHVFPVWLVFSLSSVAAKALHHDNRKEKVNILEKRFKIEGR